MARVTGRDVAALIEPAQIRLLLAIAKWRSFSGAATELGITQSSISQQIKRLEILAGFPLFRRNRRGVALTSECEIVIHYAQAMNNLADDMRKHFDQVPSGSKVSIGMSEDFCRTALPSVLGLLIHNFPHIEVQIVSGSYDLLAEAIVGQAVDIVVMRRWDRFPDSKLLWADTAVWYGHDRFSSGVIDPVPLALPLATNPTRTSIMNTLRAHGRTWKISFEAIGIAGIEAALVCGLGLIGAPRSMQFHGVTELGPESGLPPLPDIDFVMFGPAESASGVTKAVAHMLNHLATTGFQPRGAFDQVVAAI